MEPCSSEVRNSAASAFGKAMLFLLEMPSGQTSTIVRLPRAVVSALSYKRKQLSQSSFDLLHTFQNRWPMLSGIRGKLTVDNNLKSVANLVVQFRNPPDVFPHPPMLL